MREQAAPPFECTLRAPLPRGTRRTVSLLLLSGVRGSHKRVAQLAVRVAGAVDAVAVYGLLDAAMVSEDLCENDRQEVAREGDAAGIVGALVHVSPRCFYAPGRFDPPSLHTQSGIAMPILTAQAVNVRSSSGGIRLVEDLVFVGRDGVPGDDVAEAPRVVGSLGTKLRRPEGGIIGDCAIIVGGSDADFKAHPRAVLILGDSSRGRHGENGAVVCPGGFGDDGDFAVARLERRDCGLNADASGVGAVWELKRVDFFSLAVSKDEQTRIPSYP
jgi:hypothetical protein